jgi:hypothetical protein
MATLLVVLCIKNGRQNLAPVAALLGFFADFVIMAAILA